MMRRAALAVLLVWTPAACVGAVARRLEAAASYEAQQLACVDRNPDRASIDACRARVRAAWSPSDAGIEADRD